MEITNHPEKLTTTVIDQSQGQTGFNGLFREVVLHTEVNQKPGERTTVLEVFGSGYGNAKITLTPEEQEALIKGLQRHQNVIINLEEQEETPDVQPEETN